MCNLGLCETDLPSFDGHCKRQMRCFKLWDLGAYPIFWQRQVKIRTVINDIQKLGIYPETWRYKLPTALWSIVGIQWYTMNPITNPRSGVQSLLQIWAPKQSTSSDHKRGSVVFQTPWQLVFFAFKSGGVHLCFTSMAPILHSHGSFRAEREREEFLKRGNDRRSSEYSAMIQLVHLSPNTLWGSLRCIARN